MARNLPEDKRQSKMLDTDPEPIIEVEEKRVKERTDFDHDEVLVSWAKEQWSSIDAPSRYVCRVARFKNGMRGIQLVRGKDIKNPSFSGSMVFHPDEYYSLAQCIFRDSHFIRELCQRHPEGTDPLVDQIRDFVRSV